MGFHLARSCGAPRTCTGITFNHWRERWSGCDELDGCSPDACRGDWWARRPKELRRTGCSSWTTSSHGEAGCHCQTASPPPYCSHPHATHPVSGMCGLGTPAQHSGRRWGEVEGDVHLIVVCAPRCRHGCTMCVCVGVSVIDCEVCSMVPAHPALRQVSFPHASLPQFGGAGRGTERGASEHRAHPSPEITSRRPEGTRELPLCRPRTMLHKVNCLL
jgi:hypothetical protein